MVVCALPHAARHTGVLYCVLFMCAQSACQNGLTVRADEHTEDILRIVAVTAWVSVIELDSPSIAQWIPYFLPATGLGSECKCLVSQSCTDCNNSADLSRHLW